jgi:hypothetical protein
MTTSKKMKEPLPVYGTPPAGMEADLKGSFTAMRRAAQRARQVAQQTGTDLIVWRAGKVVRIRPSEKTSS